MEQTIEKIDELRPQLRYLMLESLTKYIGVQPLISLILHYLDDHYLI